MSFRYTVPQNAYRFNNGVVSELTAADRRELEAWFDRLARRVSWCELSRVQQRLLVECYLCGLTYATENDEMKAAIRLSQAGFLEMVNPDQATWRATEEGAAFTVANAGCAKAVAS